ncbi:MAG: carboxypeptidase-like regulatory domain-containing protein [Pyrinomonadaceae bacterium]
MSNNQRSSSFLAIRFLLAALIAVVFVTGATISTGASNDRLNDKKGAVGNKGTKADSPEGTTPFASGNLVVCRVGDGSATLAAVATVVFLDEFTPAGTLVRSIAVPSTTAGARLTLTGNSTTECEITRSSDGRFIMIPGYDAAVGSATPASQTSAAVPRVIGRVDQNVIFNLTTSTTSFSAQNIRGAASTDGTNMWAVGSGTGTVFTTLGATGAGTVVTSDLTNSRTVNIFGGQLYTSSGSGTLRMNSVGSGVPTTSGQVTTSLPGMPTATVSLNSFFLADLSAGVAGLDTLYIADDQSVGAGTIRKFTFDGTSWAATGVANSLAQYRGLTGSVSGGNVTIYATRGGTELVSLVDSTGYNGTLAATPTLLATAGTNTGFRGVVLAPQASTAAGVGISGRILTADGRGITNAVVTITGNALAEPRTVITGRRGTYMFDDLEPGETYIVTVRARRFMFSNPSQVISIVDNVTDADFIADGVTTRAVEPARKLAVTVRGKW